MVDLEPVYQSDVLQPRYKKLQILFSVTPQILQGGQPLTGKKTYMHTKIGYIYNIMYEPENQLAHTHMLHVFVGRIVMGNDDVVWLCPCCKLHNDSCMYASCDVHACVASGNLW